MLFGPEAEKLIEAEKAKMMKASAKEAKKLRNHTTTRKAQSQMEAKEPPRKTLEPEHKALGLSMLCEDIGFTEGEETKPPSMPLSSSADGMSQKGQNHHHSSNSRGHTPSSGERGSDQSETVASRRPTHRSEEQPDAYDLER